MIHLQFLVIHFGFVLLFHAISDYRPENGNDYLDASSVTDDGGKFTSMGIKTFLQIF